jgi:hypothetical protein
MNTLFSAQFHPTREVGGLGKSSSDLFFIDGATDFRWLDAAQNETAWAPFEAPQSETIILPPTRFSTKKNEEEALLPLY